MSVTVNHSASLVATTLPPSPRRGGPGRGEDVQARVDSQTPPSPILPAEGREQEQAGRELDQAGKQQAGEQEPFGIALLKIPRSDIPAVTHVDYSARVQSIDPVRNPFIHGVLTRFKSLTGCSVIVNTSFNVRGEPIVNTAEDAYRCFMATEIDCLVVGNRFLTRATQPHPPLDDATREQWLKRFELD